MKNNFNLNDIQDLSKWSYLLRIILAGLFAFFIFFVGKALFLGDVQNELKISKSQLKKEKDNYIKTQKLVADLPGIKKDNEKLESNLNELKKYLPVNNDSNSLIDTLHKVGGDNGINLSFAEGGTKKSKYYTVRTKTLEMQAGYLDMTSFVQAISSLNQIMHINRIKMSRLGKQKAYIGVDNSPLKIKATLKTYTFNGGAK